MSCDDCCRNKFWATSTFNVAGFLLTLIFLPDPMRISLAETDRRWRYILAGRTYHGEAINPKSLSIFERYALRLHKVYTASFLVHVLDLLCLSFATQPACAGAGLCLCSPACATTGMYAVLHTISHMLHFASYLPTGVLARDQSVSAAFCMRPSQLVFWLVLRC